MSRTRAQAADPVAVAVQRREHLDTAARHLRNVRRMPNLTGILTCVFLAADHVEQARKLDSTENPS